VADLVPKGIRLAKEKAVTGIKQKLGGVRDRIKNFLQDKWNRLKEKLGIRKPGKEGPKGGAKETPDPAAKKAAELPAAIAQAKTITEANDAANTPVPGLIGLLNASVKSKYSWIKRFEARPKVVPGHYSIHMIASDHEIDPDYTPRPGAAKGDLASELGVSSERIEHALEVLSPEEVRRLHGELGQDLFEILVNPKKPKPNVIRNFSRALELAAGDSVARKEMLEILRLTKKGSVSGAALEEALSQLVPFMERYQGRISGDFASRFRRAVQKNDPVQAKAEIRLAEDILEGRTPLGRESSVEGLPDRSIENRQTPEYRVTGSGSGNRLVEVKSIREPLAEEGIKRNVKKAISQIKEQAEETFETGGFIRIDASPSPPTTMTPEEIHRAVKGQLWFTPDSGKAGKQFVEWVEVLYNDAKGSRTVRFRVQGDDLIISP
jgi:hypothetical protein